MKQARDENARTYAYNNAIYIDKAMLNKEGYQYLEEKPAKDFKEGTDWYRNNVWHPASEEPKDKAQCLVITKRKSKDIVTYNNQFFYKGHVYGFYKFWDGYETPRKAYASMIDKTQKKGFWESNPWCIIYKFELLKED